jgi:hypothetical protein
MFEIFSYWIFVWFLLYYFNLTVYNPLLLLIIAYIFTFIELIYLIIKKVSLYNGIKFFIINIIIKLLPIILIINRIIKIDDLYISIYLILVYLITMSIFNKNPYDYYMRMINTYIKIGNDNKDYKSEVSKLYDYIYYSLTKIIKIDNIR